MTCYHPHRHHLTGGVRLQEGEYIDFGIEQFPESIPARGKQYPVHQCQPPVPIQNMHQGDEVYVNAILEQYPSISNARKRARSGVLPMVEEANSKEWTDLETMGAIAWVRDRDVPKSERRFPSQMLLALKGDAQNKIERAKGRLVLNGSSMVQGVHYSSSYASCPQWSTIRMFLALTASKKRVAMQADISNAYTRADADKIVYMRPPHDQRRYDDHGDELIAKVQKNLYGTKSGAAQWSKHLTAWLQAKGWTPSLNDHSLFTRDGAVLVAWVDDLAWSDANKAEGDRFERELTEQFGDCKVHPMDYYLGMNVSQTEVGIHICHRTLLQQAGTTYGVVEGSKSLLPMAPGTVVDAVDCPPAGKQIKMPYRSVVGTTTYVATVSRPLLSYSTGQLARVQANPGLVHHSAAVRALKYAITTKGEGILFKADSVLQLVGYCDSSFADIPVHADPGPGGTEHGRKSTEGCIILLGGAPVHWFSRRETLRALSSTEAEAIAAASATKLIVHLRRVAADMGLAQAAPTPLHIDNQPCIDLLDTHHITQRNQHMDLKIYTTRDAWKGTGGMTHQPPQISVHKIHTDDNISDCCTKALGSAKLSRFGKHLQTPDPTL